MLLSGKGHPVKIIMLVGILFRKMNFGPELEGCLAGAGLGKKQRKMVRSAQDDTARHRPFRL